MNCATSSFNVAVAGYDCFTDRHLVGIHVYLCINLWSFLERSERVHLPGVVRMFWKSLFREFLARIYEDRGETAEETRMRETRKEIRKKEKT